MALVQNDIKSGLEGEKLNIWVNVLFYFPAKIESHSEVR